MAQIGAELAHLAIRIEPLAVPRHNRANRKGVPQMPNSAFAPECRVPENAERCRLGLDLASLADRALGIVRCLLLTSCGRERT